MYASTKPPASGSLPPQHADSGLRTFSALHNRNFRLLWIGLTVSAVGTWMQIVALSLLVLDLTHGSAVALGLVSLAQALSFLVFAPVGGSAADRFDRRRLLLLTQSSLMGLAAILGILTAAGVIRFWMIPLTAFASGAMLSFDQPTRNALIASLVPNELLMNAVGLQSAVFNGASIVGPALAGLLLIRIGYSGNFFLNAISYLAVLLALLLIRAHAAPSTGGEAGWLESIREGTQFIWRDPVLVSVVSVYAALLFFGPSAVIMLPLFVRDVIHAGPAELGILFSGVGGGTVIGAVVVASVGDFPHKRSLVFGSVLVWALALAVFGLSFTLPVAVLTLILLGAAQNTAGATTMTLLQTRVPPEMRGRAMSLNTLLIMCVRPLGDFPMAAVIGYVGFRPTVLASALIVGTLLISSYVARPAIRNA